MIFQVVLVTTQVVTIESDDEEEAVRTAEHLRADIASHCHHGEKVAAHLVRGAERRIAGPDEEALPFTPPAKESMP